MLWPYHAQGSLPCRYGSFLPKWHRSKLWSAQFHPPPSPLGGADYQRPAEVVHLIRRLSPPSLMAHGCCMYYRRCRATPCAKLIESEYSTPQDWNCPPLFPFLPLVSRDVRLAARAVCPNLPPSNLITPPADRDRPWMEDKRRSGSFGSIGCKTNHGIRVTQQQQRTS